MLPSLLFGSKLDIPDHKTLGQLRADLVSIKGLRTPGVPTSLALLARLESVLFFSASQESWLGSPGLGGFTTRSMQALISWSQN